MSNSILVAMADRADKPLAPTVDRTQSSQTSLFVKWQKVTTGDIVITGYRLNMIELASGNQQVVYDGSLNSEVTSYLVQGLSTGSYYAFYVTSVNFNGESLPSDEMTAVVCLEPFHLEKPDFVSATKTSISISWTQPTSTGGCPILSYAIFSDLGVSSAAFTEIDASLIRNKPYLTSHTISNLVKTGFTHSFYLQVFNEVGSATSLITEIVLAEVPD